MGKIMLNTNPFDAEAIDDPRTDSALAAAAAVYAFRAGRIKLGLSFARIAMEADRDERERAELPAGPIWETQQAQNAQVDLFGPAEPARRLDAPETRKCIARTVRDGVNVECEGRIYWAVGRIGDARTLPVPAGWFHIHEHLDADHQAVPVQVADQG